MFKVWLGIPKTSHGGGCEWKLWSRDRCLLTRDVSVDWNVRALVIIKVPIGGAGTCGTIGASGLVVIKISFIIRSTIANAAIQKMAATCIKVSW